MPAAHFRIAWRGAVLWGVIGLTLAAAGSWLPSPWRDEAATGWVTQFPTREILGFLQHTDAVHGLYYLLIRPWVDLVGTTPFLLRLPSAVAVGIGTAAMYGVGWSLAGRRLAITAAIAYLAVPRTLAMGIEARSFAMASAAVALALLVLVVQIRRERRWLWVAYAAVSAIAVYLNLYAAPVIAGFWVGTLMLRRGWRFSLTATVAHIAAGLACLPLVVVAMRQAGQVGWISDSEFNVVEQILVEAFFPYRTVVRFIAPWEEPMRVAAIALAIIVGLLILLRAGRTLRGTPEIVWLSLPPLVLVVLLPLLYSILVNPILLPRYLTSAVPALTLLLAGCHGTLPRRAAVSLGALLLVLAAFLYVGQRDPRGKFSYEDLTWIATTVRTHGTAGDGILFDQGEDPVWGGRLATAINPEVFAELTDIAQPGPPELRAAWPVDEPPIDLASQSLPDTILLVTDPAVQTGYAVQLDSIGYERTEAWTGPAHLVESWER